jgi:hypothetical protein
MKILEFIPSGLLVVLLAILVRRRVNRIFPFFFAYVVFAVCADLARFAARSHPPTYYAAYWITEAGYGVLGILVMYEVSRTILAGLTRYGWARPFFPMILFAGIGLSVARAQAMPAQFDRRVAFCIVTGEVAVRFVQVFVFAALVSLVALLGVRWRQYAFGVATGFGLYATVMLLSTIKFSDFGTRFTFLWGLTSLVAYSVAVLVWIWFFSVAQDLETGSKLSAPHPGVITGYKDALRRMR